MALTRDFRTTVRARMQRDPALRRALFREAIDCFRSGEPEVGKNILRYLPATQAAKALKQAGKGMLSQMRSEITIGSGNVFADIGHPNPEEALAKAQMTSRISAAIRERGLTHVKAAALLKIDRTKLSALERGSLSQFSLATLRRYLRLLSRQA